MYYKILCALSISATCLTLGISADIPCKKLEQLNATHSKLAKLFTADETRIEWKGPETGIKLLQNGPNYPHLYVTFHRDFVFKTETLKSILDLNPQTLVLEGVQKQIPPTFDIQQIIHHPNFGNLESCRFNCFYDIHPFIVPQFITKIRGVAYTGFGGMSPSFLERVLPEEIATIPLTEFCGGLFIGGTAQDLFMERLTKIQSSQSKLNLFTTYPDISGPMNDATLDTLMSASTELSSYQMVVPVKITITEQGAERLKTYIASQQKLTNFFFGGQGETEIGYFTQAIIEGLIHQAKDVPLLTSFGLTSLSVAPEQWSAFQQFVDRQTALTELQLNGNNMGERTIDILTAFLRNNPNLQKVYLGSDINSEALDEALKVFSGHQLRVVQFSTKPSIATTVQFIKNQPSLDGFEFFGDVSFSSDEVVAVIGGRDGMLNPFYLSSNLSDASSKGLIQKIVAGLRVGASQPLLPHGGKVFLNFYNSQVNSSYTVYNNTLKAVVNIVFGNSGPVKVINAEIADATIVEDATVTGPSTASAVAATTGLLGLGFWGL